VDEKFTIVQAMAIKDGKILKTGSNEEVLKTKGANTVVKDIEGKTKEIDSVTIKEIMEFDDMPIKSYTEIVTEMSEKFQEYYKNYIRIEEEINKLLKLKTDARRQGAINIELKVNTLLDDMNNEKMKLNLSRRVFYNRLKALDLIED
jgi:ABC-type proline/glycine betaine transport system ATPase subunit